LPYGHATVESHRRRNFSELSHFPCARRFLRARNSLRRARNGRSAADRPRYGTAKVPARDKMAFLGGNWRIAFFERAGCRIRRCGNLTTGSGAVTRVSDAGRRITRARTMAEIEAIERRFTGKRPAPLVICDDRPEARPRRHVWAEPFHDGDTCACGQFYLDLHPVTGFRAELTTVPAGDD